jgi:hypothetical protein
VDNILRHILRNRSAGIKSILELVPRMEEDHHHPMDREDNIILEWGRDQSSLVEKVAIQDHRTVQVDRTAPLVEQFLLPLTEV